MVMSERDVQDSLKFMREKLRKERKAQNMSQLTLSAEADLACNTICRIEKGTAEPGIGLPQLSISNAKAPAPRPHFPADPAANASQNFGPKFSVQ